MRCRRLMFAAGLTLATVPAVSGSALADHPQGGATVTNRNFCFPSQFGVVCIDDHTVINATETPSGNASVVANGRATITVTTADGCTFTEQTKFHDHFLVKAGELGPFQESHEGGNRQESVSTVNCFGRQTTCTYTSKLHYVDGTFQYNYSDFICEEA